MGWIKSPRGGTCCECQANVCDPCDPTPCDLTEPDNTDLGSVSIPDITVTPPSATSFGTFEVMGFNLEYVNGCWSYETNQGCGAAGTRVTRCYTTLGHSFSYSNGFSTNPLAQPGSDRCDLIYTGGLDCVSQAADCSFVSGITTTGEFRHRGGDLSLVWDGAGGYGTLITRFNGAPNNPKWRLRRVRRFAYTFTASGKIKDYSTYATGNWKITFDGQTTAALLFTATAGDVQTALNALSNIIAQGGVTVSGSLAAGWSIAWNNVGNRNPVTATVTTVNIGWRFTISTITNGDVTTAEVQKVLLEFGCSTCASAPGLTEWDGTFSVEDITDFDQLVWRATTVPNQGTLKLNEQKMYLAEVRYSTSLGGLTTSGCGWILTIACMNGSGDFVLEWEGIKGTGADWIGQYARTTTDVGDGIMCNTTNGPASLTIEVYP